jgi:hypothetical protein
MVDMKDGVKGGVYLLGAIGNGTADVARLTALLIRAELSFGARVVLTTGRRRLGGRGCGRGSTAVKILASRASRASTEAFTRGAGMGYARIAEAFGKNLRRHGLEKGEDSNRNNKCN